MAYPEWVEKQKRPGTNISCIHGNRLLLQYSQQSSQLTASLQTSLLTATMLRSQYLPAQQRLTLTMSQQLSSRLTQLQQLASTHSTALL